MKRAACLSTILVLAAMLLAGCGPQTRPTSQALNPAPEAASAPGPAFREVRIASYPPGSGYAHKTVNRDGTITGAHLSGGPGGVRVHETTSTMSAEDLAALGDLARKVPASSPQAETRTEQGHTYVVISRPDGTTATFGAAWGQKFETREVQAIWDLLYKYNVGAW